MGERVKNQVRKLLDCYVKISIREEGGGEEEKGKDADVRSDRIFKFRDSFFSRLWARERERVSKNTNRMLNNFFTYGHLLPLFLFAHIILVGSSGSPLVTTYKRRIRIVHGTKSQDVYVRGILVGWLPFTQASQGCIASYSSSVSVS